MADLTTVAAEETSLNRRFVDRSDSTFAELVESDQQQWARLAAGQYFKATNPTFGTGIAQAIQTTWSATTPLLVIDNSDTAGGVTVYLDYVKLICTVAGATTTSGQLGIILDTITRYSSGGSTLSAQCANSGKSTTAKAVIHFGAVTALAASAARQVGRDTIKTQAAPCWVVGDEVLIKCGAVDGLAGPTSGAATNVYPAPTGPIAIGPGHSCCIYLWNPANATTAPSWEIEMAWWETVR